MKVYVLIEDWWDATQWAGGTCVVGVVATEAEAERWCAGTKDRDWAEFTVGEVGA